MMTATEVENVIRNAPIKNVTILRGDHAVVYGGFMVAIEKDHPDNWTRNRYKPQALWYNGTLIDDSHDMARVERARNFIAEMRNRH